MAIGRYYLPDAYAAAGGSNPHYIALTCAACGAKLGIDIDIDQFACASCGTEYLVQRGGGVVSLQPLTETFSDIAVQEKRIVVDMAIARLKREIAADEAQLARTQADFEVRQAKLEPRTPGGKLYLDAIGLVVLGVGSIATTNPIAIAIGVLLLCGAIWPMMAINRITQYNRRLTGERNALMLAKRQQKSAAQAEIAEKIARLNAWQRSLD